MSSSALICRMKSYIQPFERRLALMELEALSTTTPIPLPSPLPDPLDYRIVTTRAFADLIDRLTYWESIGFETGDGQHTRQVRREATAGTGHNSISRKQPWLSLPLDISDARIPSRRTLRYGSHGAHEYRGKFFPQLARSLLNLAGVKHGDPVLDPMCGSGTTLIEASLIGCTAFGVDINPLSVLMSRAKTAILQTAPNVIAAEYDALKADLLRTGHEGRPLTWLADLAHHDQAYLISWFAPHVLTVLDAIAVRVHAVEHEACRELFRLCLSNILRRVSWQKEDDLRVRREVRPAVDMDVTGEFITELTRTVRSVLAFLYEDQPEDRGAVHVIEGDARFLIGAKAPFEHMAGQFKAVVTSPPYATALPYLDTDRLSLSFLGLLPRAEHRRRDYLMIGNREVTERQRSSYWSEYERQRAALPGNIVSVIDRIHDLNAAGKVGFRRRNLPSLLARYFLDMRDVFQGVTVLLAPRAPAYVVIGDNHTVAGGVHVEIETDHLLGSLGQAVGLRLTNSIPMEMLVSRDIFRRNAGTCETILEFRRL